MRFVLFAGAVLTVASIAFFALWPRPTGSVARIDAIRAASEQLMAQHPADGGWHHFEEFPAAIAELEPEKVSLYDDGLHITTKGFFDGGWGYLVTRDEKVVPTPEGRFRQVAPQVYWWNPY